MGSRSVERGEAALKSLIEESPACQGKIELLQVDTCSEQSIIAARDSIKAKLGEGKLFGLCNNAGTGLAHGVSADVMV
jgi:short-subunit dehydrogenase